MARTSGSRASMWMVFGCQPVTSLVLQLLREISQVCEMSFRHRRCEIDRPVLTGCCITVIRSVTGGWPKSDSSVWMWVSWTAVCIVKSWTHKWANVLLVKNMFHICSQLLTGMNASLHLGGVMVRVPDLWSVGCKFDSAPCATGLVLEWVTVCRWVLGKLRM